MANNTNEKRIRRMAKIEIETRGYHDFEFMIEEIVAIRKAGFAADVIETYKPVISIFPSFQDMMKPSNTHEVKIYKWVEDVIYVTDKEEVDSNGSENT